MAYAQTEVVLIADRYLLSQQLLKSILEDSGYRVLTAADGNDAWPILSSNSVDILITDLDLPHLSGLELCQRLKSSEKIRLIPVIIVTSADNVASRIAAFEHGADDILPKPVISEELLARVRNLLRFSRLVRDKLKLQLSQAKLEKELALAKLRKDEELARNRFFYEVLYAATAGRLQLMEWPEMAPLLEGWHSVQELEITHPSQIAAVRAIGEKAALEAGLDFEAAADVAICLSEAVTNGLKFGTLVAFRAGIFEDQLRFIVEDNGPGLERALLPRVTLQKGFSTGVSMGLGFSLMIEMMDRVGLCTTHQGTTLLLAKFTSQNVDNDIDAFLQRFSVSLDS